MPELQEPPTTEAGENLASNFDKALAATTEDGSGYQQNVGEVPTKKEPPVVVKKEPEPSKDDDAIVPAQFLDPTKKEGSVDSSKVEIVDDPPLPTNAPAKMLREAIDRKDALIKRIQNEIQELRKAPSPPATPAGPTQEHLDALKSATERAAQLEQELERSAYERSPKFQKFGAEHSAEITAAKSYLEGTDISPGLVEAAANTSGATRIKLFRDNGVDSETIASIMPHLARADSIRRERDASLDNWKTSLAQESEQYKARQTQEEGRRAEEERRVFTEVGEQMRKENPAFTRVEANEKWNAIVEQNEKDAEAFFSGSKPLPELAKLAYDGVSARTIRMMNGELTRMLNEARAENSKLKAAQPGTGKAATPSSATKPNADDPKQAHQHYATSFDRAMAEAKGG